MDKILLLGFILIFFGLVYLLLKGMGKISDKDADIQIMGSRLKGSPGIIVIVLGVLLIALGSGFLIDNNNINEKTVINWSSPADIAYGTALSGAQLNAEASIKEGILTYNPASGTVLSTGIHELHVDFTPADTVKYSTASKDVTLIVTKATPVITWSNLADITYGTALNDTHLNAVAKNPVSGATVDGTFEYTQPAGTKLEVGTHTLKVDFTPKDTDNYTEVSKNNTFNVIESTYSELASAVFGGKQNVYYLGSDNHVYELAYNGNNWVSEDLTTAGKGQLAATGSALTTIDAGQSVFYLGSNNHVYELAYRDKWVWRDLTADAVRFQEIYEPVVSIYEHGDYQGRSQKLSPGKYNMGDLSIGDDTLSSLKVPDGMRVTLYEHVNFGGNKKIFETDSSFLGADFNDKTSSILVELVTNGAGQAPLAASRSALTSAVISPGLMGVYYLGSDNHVYELAYDGTKWVSVDLTTAGKGQLAATGSALTTVTVDAGQSVFYLGSNNHVYELAHRGSNVFSVDLTEEAEAPDATTGSALTSAVFGGKQNVYYLGSDNHVYELAYDGTKWVSVDLTTAGKGKLAAAGSALTTVVIPHGTSVFYLGSNNHVYELGHRGTRVISVDLTADATPQGQLAASSSSLTSAVDGNGQHSVYYLGSDNHVCELAYDGNNWVWSDLITDAKTL